MAIYDSAMASEITELKARVQSAEYNAEQQHGLVEMAQRTLWEQNNLTRSLKAQVATRQSVRPSLPHSQHGALGPRHTICVLLQVASLETDLAAARSGAGAGGGAGVGVGAGGGLEAGLRAELEAVTAELATATTGAAALVSSPEPTFTLPYPTIYLPLPLPYLPPTPTLTLPQPLSIALTLTLALTPLSLTFSLTLTSYSGPNWVGVPDPLGR